MGTSEKLQQRLNEFLPTLRLGVDTGESTGGIALVQGNSILHSETYVDFYDATLETRRTLRRQRRTRQAKKMRLARLRSWLLRQEIPAAIPGAENKNGKSRLPDPYRLMKDKRYWTLPDFYKVAGKDPVKADRWEDKAKKGEVDAEGFVIALTRIFKKRGYKYDDRDFEELSDEKLLDFLNSCCMLKEAGNLSGALKKEVERRENKKLITAYGEALNRQIQPRKALPRQIKEADLKEIVSQFVRRYGLSNDIETIWHKELIGLLNKVIRPARYDNRIKSGCSWCGKRTPRLKKPEIRERNFKAALNNIRIQPNKSLGYTRPITEDEKTPFLKWFENRLKEREGNYIFPQERKCLLLNVRLQKTILKNILKKSGQKRSGCEIVRLKNGSSPFPCYLN